MPIIDLLLPEFDQEMANTRKMLERVPDDKFTYKPHPKASEMGALANHIATLVAWTKDTIDGTEFDFAPIGGPPYNPPKAKNNAELLAIFDESVAGARGALASVTDEELFVPWSLKAGGQTLFTLPRIACIRSFVMNHTIHHRAHLGMYLRLSDIPVPGMYGPSADEKMPM